MPPTAAPSVPQATDSGQALNNLQSFQGSMVSPDQAYSQATQSLGVPQAQQQVSGLRQAITNTTNLLNNVAPSIMGRTQNSLVTSAQANRQIQNEQAPISQQLGKQETDFSGANSDLEHLLGEAGTQAGLKVQGQQNQLGLLKSVYDALFGQEQAKASQALEQQKLQEQMRQFNVSSDLQKQGLSANNAYLQALLGGNNSKDTTVNTGQTPQFMSPRPDGGFNFINPVTNSPINAYQFSQATGTPFRALLQDMANKGDSGAKAALNFVGDDGGYDPSKITNQNLANLYSALTGRQAHVYQTPGTINKAAISTPTTSRVQPFVLNSVLR